jgi:hypothetical protein
VRVQLLAVMVEVCEVVHRVLLLSRSSSFLVRCVHGLVDPSMHGGLSTRGQQSIGRLNGPVNVQRINHLIKAQQASLDNNHDHHYGII